MKKTSIILAGLLLCLSVLAHNSIDTSDLTIIVAGNKNLQVSVDGKDYKLINNITNGNKTTISVNNLEMGQHTFQVIRTDRNNKRSERISTIFNLRSRYAMLIKINGNGSIELIETMKDGVSVSQPPMNNVNFNTLLRSVKNQRSINGRRSLIATAFANANNHFTTYQVIQLLQLVNSENFRLQLAKSSYRTVTDRNNFNQVNELLTSQASKNELDDYVNNFAEEEYQETAMSDAAFNNLYQTIRQEWPIATQMNSLTNAFTNSNYYFTSYQAEQLIQIVSAESNRLQLAKFSYHSIIDPANFSLVYKLLNNQASKDELTAYINNYTGNNYNVAMSDANFNSLYQTIRQQWPASTQMNSLTNAFTNSNNYFTSNQARQLIQLINNESNRLELAKLSYRTITDRNNFSQVYELLNNQASKDELTAYINNYTGNNYNEAMSDANFNSLYQTIRQQWPVSTQMNSLTNAFTNSNNYFTSSQARQLIQLINNESNRLELAKLSYRTITDRNNFSQVYELLNNQASKDELTAYINNYTGNNNKVAMSDADFTAFYQNLERQFLPGEQMVSLTMAFNNTENYFTSAQVKQLIPLVSYESNRLQLAKLAYRTVTDRNNFSQVYELLSSQASRNELDAYVKAYKE